MPDANQHPPSPVNCPHNSIPPPVATYANQTFLTGLKQMHCSSSPYIPTTRRTYNVAFGKPYRHIQKKYHNSMWDSSPEDKPHPTTIHPSPASFLSLLHLGNTLPKKKYRNKQKQSVI